MNLIKLNKNDNVAVVVNALSAGAILDSEFFKGTITEDIPAGHKIAFADIKSGDNVIKYGFPIGFATEDISAGRWVHTHNLKSDVTDKLEIAYRPQEQVSKLPGSDIPSTFMGYRRANGKVGIRNQIWIIPMVGCVNQTAKTLADRFSSSLPDSVDAVVAFSHPYGCSQLGDDHENTRKLLACLALHPNAAGVLLVGLGCENNAIQDFLPLLGDYDKQRIKHLITQQCTDEIAEGVKIIGELISDASKDTRTGIDISQLCVGLKCGGSDGMSGITANPLCGAFTDMLDSAGGSTILTEVPEMFGAESALLSLCKDKNVFDRAMKMITDFRQYYIDHGLPVTENPSPGNIEGGITTIEEKSLGCVAKAGHAQIADVLSYAQPIRTAGLSLLDGPGNDIIAVTNLAAAGAHLILFTTGRGTPLGGPVPTIKISSNHLLANTKPNWIDFNAADLLENRPIRPLAAELLDFVVQVASGEEVTKNEKFGYSEIAIFKTGVTL